MILLARHGETDWNAPPARMMGWTDLALNERGREQARELAAQMRHEGLAAVWSSPLLRARETAEIVAAEVGLPVTLEPGLRESRRGAWEGRRFDELARDEPEAWEAWRRAGASFRFPGGESLAEHAERVAAALARIAAGPLPALAVCHGGTIRCAVALAGPRGLDGFHELAVPNAAVVRLERVPEYGSGRA